MFTIASLSVPVLLVVQPVGQPSPAHRGPPVRTAHAVPTGFAVSAVAGNTALRFG